MSRWIAVIRGIGLLAAAPAAVMGLLTLANDLVRHGASPRGSDVAASGMGAAALLLVVAALLVPPPDGARASQAIVYVISVLLTPLSACVFYVATADPVALFLGVPLLLPPLTVMLLWRAASCPLRRGGVPAA